MTMTRDEYLEFVFSEHRKVLQKDHRNARAGQQVVFYGSFGRAVYTRGTDGTWDREIK